ncbi:MAG: type II toxin-antitoxin system RelE/ParE family toxin [Cyclobacteriaceae bacterium]
MKKLRLEIQEAAYKDLEDIWTYTLETWSIGQADKYYNDIIAAIEFLCANPKSGKSAEHLRKGYRFFKINSHLIFYIFSDSELNVIRILHSQMDIPNRLKD